MASTRRWRAVTRFFLHVCNRTVDAPDKDGQLFADLSAAREEAIVGIRSLLGHELAEGTLDLRGEIRIDDETGRRVLVVPFTEALRILT